METIVLKSCNDVGKKARAVAKAKKITIRKLSELCDISHGTLLFLLYKPNNASFNSIQALGRGLGVNFVIDCSISEDKGFIPESLFEANTVAQVQELAV